MNKIDILNIIILFVTTLVGCEAIISDHPIYLIGALVILAIMQIGMVVQTVRHHNREHHAASSTMRNPNWDQ